MSCCGGSRPSNGGARCGTKCASQPCEPRVCCPPPCCKDPCIEIPKCCPPPCCPIPCKKFALVVSPPLCPPRCCVPLPCCAPDPCACDCSNKLPPGTCPVLCSRPIRKNCCPSTPKWPEQPKMPKCCSYPSSCVIVKPCTSPTETPASIYRVTSPRLSGPCPKPATITVKCPSSMYPMIPGQDNSCPVIQGDTSCEGGCN